MSTDSEIVRRSWADPAAFGELYDRHASIIHRYASRRSNSSIADDILSETFLVAFERRKDFDLERDDARPWLYGIATTLLKKHSRLETKAWMGLVAGGVGEVNTDAIEAAGSRIDAEIEVARLASALARMPAKDRDTLLLHAWADLDYEGIALALGVPIGTVRSRLNRARRTLRALDDRGAAPDMEVDHGRINTASQGA